MLTKRRGQSTIIEDYRRQRVNLKIPKINIATATKYSPGRTMYSHSYNKQTPKQFAWVFVINV